VQQPNSVRAVVTLSGCNATLLRGDGPTGLALRSALAAVAGLPLADVTLVGVRCADDAAAVVYTISSADACNAWNGTALVPPPRRRALGAAVGDALRRRLTDAADASSMLVDAQLSNIPAAPTGLGNSSTGVPALPTLTAELNVAARVAAIDGGVLPTYFADAAASAGVAVAVNGTGIAAALGGVSAAWAATTGQNATAVAVGVRSVAAYVPPSAAPTTHANLSYVAGPVIGGAALAAAVLAAWYAAFRRRKRGAVEHPRGGASGVPPQATPVTSVVVGST